MKIEKNDMVMVYDVGGTVPHCKYTGRFGDLTAYWQEIVSDAVYLFRLGESEERAFELAKNEYLAWLEHKADRYTTVYGYMD